MSASKKLLRACKTTHGRIYSKKRDLALYKRGPFHCASGVEAEEYERLVDDDVVRRYGLQYDPRGGVVSICGDNTGVHASIKGWVSAVLQNEVFDMGIPTFKTVCHWTNMLLSLPNGMKKMVDNVLYTRKPEVSSMEIPIVVVEVAFYNESFDKLKENVREIMKLDTVTLAAGLSVNYDEGSGGVWFQACIGYAGELREYSRLEGQECFVASTDTIFKGVPDLPTNIRNEFRFPLGQVVEFASCAGFMRSKKDMFCCVVIEDSRIGLQAAKAAKAAGMTCIVTKSVYTTDENFDRADPVFDFIDFGIEFC
ncbi:hypothetical protein SELMODRAFT_408251 [Selaginella moellendorffii]|uniref:Uncharacterized protein n=1 Tax=Selaginella moellendorffii TaxID=88036 RepID=D8R7P7_SELML|nr:hypothetical protein SELMODRAFT_408251 [Selaginella moellendorffii]